MMGLEVLNIEKGLVEMSCDLARGIFDEVGEREENN
jgi:hypothetical protein